MFKRIYLFALMLFVVSAPYLTQAACPTTSPGGVGCGDLEIWLKADVGANEAASDPAEDGDGITIWEDQGSIRTNDAVNGTNLAPIYRTNRINFNPALTFNGTTDYGLHFGSDYVFFPLGSGGARIYVVNRPNSSGGNRYSLDFGRYNANAYGLVMAQNIMKLNAVSASGGSATLYTYPSTIGDFPHVGEGHIDLGSEHRIYFDGFLGATAPITYTSLTAININEAAVHQSFNGPVTIGRQSKSELIDANNGRFHGQIAEVIVLSTNSTMEENVRSYLALKYGITLDQSGAGQGYYASDWNGVTGTMMWDIDSTYKYNIAGIGRDDTSELHQKKSKSESEAGDILTVAHGNDFNNPTSLDDDKDFLVWSNDNGSKSTIVSTTIGTTKYERLQRIYRAQNTGSVGNVSVEFDLSAMGTLYSQATSAAVLIDTDTDFSNATLHTAGVSIVGNKFYFDNLVLQDGDYFTIVVQRSPNVTLSASPSSISEAAAASTITATLAYESNLANTITLATSGTATGSGTDYTLGSSSVSIASGSLSGNTDVTSAQDVLIEGNETVIIDIDTASSANESSPQQQTVTILDDETPPTVTLSRAPAAVTENGGVSTVTATLSAAAAVDITINLGFTGTATGGGADYTASAASITIAAGSTTGNITITGNDDVVDEANETVVVDITSISPLGIESGGSQQVTVTLNDDDADVLVSLSASAASIAEAAGSTTITATLSAVSGQDVTINLGFSGTATGAGTDYTASGASITILAGATTGNVTLTAVQDTLDEPNESIVVDVTSVTGGTEDGSQQETISITDDDAAPTVAISAGASSIGEALGSTTITATLSAVSAQDVTINLGFSGTATGGGTDYTASGASITILAGDLTGEVTIASDNDSLDEVNETIIVDVTSVTNGTESGSQQETISITDDDAAPSVSLSSTSATMAEAAGSTTLTATLSVVSGQDVTINLGFTGTATGAGTDYTASGASITILAGSTTGSVTITADQDSLDEPNETVIVDITGVTNGNESGTQQETVTITDDDAAPTVALSASSNSISENGGSTTITATLSAISSQNVTITLAYTGNATGSGTDYTSSSVTIVILAGNTTGTVVINTVNDATYEANELINIDIASIVNGTEVGTEQQVITIVEDDLAPDTDGDGVLDNVECPLGSPCPDNDGDGDPDYNDIDSDNDGFDDMTECPISMSCADFDGDGIPDYVESNIINTDGEGSFDYNDTDADGDGVTDAAECGTTFAASASCADTDSDNIPEWLDAQDAGSNAGDSDGDGIQDNVECPTGYICVDTDDDGIPNYIDLDSDGDGKQDGGSTDSLAEDCDEDGIKDYFDLSACPNNPNPPVVDNTDTDGDGVTDAEEIERGTNPNQRDYVVQGSGTKISNLLGCQSTGGSSMLLWLLMLMPFVLKRYRLTKVQG